MTKRIGAWLTAMVLLAGAAQGQSPSPRITLAAPAQVGRFDPFTVRASIENTSTRDQVFGAWACAYPQQFQSDNPAIGVEGASCRADRIDTVRLAPGQARDFALRVAVYWDATAALAPSELGFRLGFQPANAPASAVVWSNAVTVRVR